MRLLVFIVFGFGVFFSIGTHSLHAQVYGSNTFEFQYGNLPHQNRPDYTTSYDQLNLFYDSDNISFFGKFEQFLSTYEDRNFTSKERNYAKLTQKRFQYQDDNFRIRIGNFYETIGRGLLLRSYDIPGSVYEDDFNRIRYGFFRDLEGISIDANNKWLEIKALRAEPLYNSLPPNFKPDSLRRPDLVEAIQANIFINEQLSVGGAFMRSHPGFTNEFKEYGSLMFNFSPISNIQIFSEYAFETNTNLTAFNQEDSYALYTGLNFYLDSFGGSLEYKNYNLFLLGQGYNDPPSLIKEHTYPVLNRSTHVLNTSNETGIQAEFYYNFDAGHSLTTNITTAKNNISKGFNYTEYFLEGYYKIDDYLSIKSFVDYANDDLKGEEHRTSFGLITDKSFNYDYGFILDLQFQTFNRPFDTKTSKNYYTSLTFSYLPDFAAGIIFEASTDPQQTDNPTTFPEEESKTRTWIGSNISYKVNSNNRVDLFIGKRRGGPACTSGICYEILDFEGIELRFSTRF